MRLVLDASVLIKWLIADPVREADTERAARLVERAGVDGNSLILPPHWLAEVAALLCRLSPDTAAADIETLHLLEWPVLDEAGVYRRAVAMASQLKQHLFDTLYHAVALESGAALVTADEAYWRKARALGAITLLRDAV
ncbi:MAG: type II toxin-antitoxin system VapC family toxin [Acidiferrobacteraceae bacterium]